MFQLAVSCSVDTGLNIWPYAVNFSLAHILIKACCFHVQLSHLLDNKMVNLYFCIYQDMSVNSITVCC